MKNKSQISNQNRTSARKIKWSLLILSFFVIITFLAIVIFSLFINSHSKKTEEKNQMDETFLYHIIITGTYENRDFLEKVYEGASKFAKYYNSVVDLHVPQSQAEDLSLQALLDYCSFLNADGIIAYINEPSINEDAEENHLPLLLQRADEPEIPLVTLGYFSTEIPQISFIGSNDWEMGKKIGNEALILVKNTGCKKVVIVSGVVAGNSINLVNSLQLVLREDPAVLINVIESFDNLDFTSDFFEDCIFITVNEKDTISVAQKISESKNPATIKLIGFGGSEVCQLYFEKGWITELISLDTEKIGSSAIKELFEYKNHFSANSYVIADLKISRKNEEINEN